MEPFVRLKKREKKVPNSESEYEVIDDSNDGDGQVYSAPHYKCEISEGESTVLYYMHISIDETKTGADKLRVDFRTTNGLDPGYKLTTDDFSTWTCVLEEYQSKKAF